MPACSSGIPAVAHTLTRLCRHLDLNGCSIRPWGTLPTGERVNIITLEGPNGAIAEVSTFGGMVRSLCIPLSNGVRRQVVLGFETLDAYLADTDSIGVTVGPYANRIRSGTFQLDGRRYHLVQNEGQNTLHGGYLWQRAVYRYEICDNTLVLRHQSPDGEGGFPGKRDVAIRFSWQMPMSFQIDYRVETDRPTVVSMTNHSYFCLTPGADACSHKLQVQAETYTPIDSETLPTGEIYPVAGTEFDFRAMRPIARHYDHNFVLTGGESPAAMLEAPDGALSMAVYTDMPGLQLYTSEFLKPPFSPGAAVCLETQQFPDAPNMPQFPSSVCTQTKPYVSQTTFAFAVRP